MEIKIFNTGEEDLEKSPHNTEHEIQRGGICELEIGQDIPHSEDLDNFENEHLRADLPSNPQEIDFQDPLQGENIEIEQIRTWAVESNLSCSVLDKLLQILRSKLLPKLPKSSKTFLETTSAEYEIITMQDSSSDEILGEFVYLGIAKGLESYINTDFHDQNIELIVNIDGLPLTKSGRKCFWPILCKVHYVPDVYKPFTVAIYCGDSKPKSLSRYLKDFITEINYLQKNGIVISGKNYTVKLKCIVADTPARSYLKCIKGHGGYSACERCTVRGVMTTVGKGSSVVYPGSDYPQRTDTSFRNRHNPEHHTGVSPLEKICPRVDMPNICILDFMHLGSGVSKKILEMLMFGPLTVRLGRRQKMELSRRLLSLTLQLPSEFQRKTRSIFHVRQWKATEFRFFLLYCGPIVLKNIIPKDSYKHFLLLHVAFRILCSDDVAISLNSVAKKYLKKFVLALPLLYGTAAQVMNMHNLVHIADDVLNLGCSLSRVNCFPFENALGAIKRSLRTAVKPISQFCRREHERKMLKNERVTLPMEFKIHKSKIVNGSIIIKRLTTNCSTFLTDKKPNNMVLLQNGYIMRIEQICGQEAALSSVFITGKVWKTKNAAYNYPQKSDRFGTWSIAPDTSHTMTYPLSHVQRKLIAMQLAMKPGGRDRLYVMSLLHT